MTVALTVSEAEWDEAGSAGPYTFNFKFMANSDITIIRTNDDGSATLVEGVDYTLTGAGSANGGAITLLNPQDVGGTLNAVRNVDQRQLTSIINQQSFHAELHEQVFDRLAMGIQDLSRRMAGQEVRELTISITQTVSGTVATTPIDTSLGNVLVQLPAAGMVRLLKDGEDANTVSWVATVPGQEVDPWDPLSGPGEFIQLELIGNKWRKTG
jgi:hypothetical protein